MRKKLKDLAVIRAGYQFRGRVEDDPHGTTRVIQIRDFDEERRLRSDRLARVTMPRDPAPFAVNRGDVLFLSRGHRLWAAVIDQELPETVASGYFFMLRPDESIRPHYLAWYMTQEPFQAALRPIHRGSLIPLVSRVDFEELEVDVPPLTVQDRIVNLDELSRREQNLLDSIASKRGQVVTSVCMRAAQRGAGKGKHKS